MANEHKGIALVILGIVAVIAIVGLVLLFTGAKEATGNGIYGGAIKQIEYPDWVGRGVPQNVPGVDYIPGQTSSNDLHTSWNYYGNPKKNPIGDVPSPLKTCGQGAFLVPVNPEQAGYYQSIGYTVVGTGGSKAGVCVFPPATMIGGIAGQSQYGAYGKNFG